MINCANHLKLVSENTLIYSMKLVITVRYVQLHFFGAASSLHFSNTLVSQEVSSRLSGGPMACFWGGLEHFGFSGGLMKSFRGLLENLNVSGGAMKRGGLEHLGSTSYQVIPPWGQRRRHCLKHDKLARLKKSKKSEKIPNKSGAEALPETRNLAR